MKNIYVTEPSLPPLSEFIPYLEKIWENRRLTNNGPFHQEFEKKLANYLGVEHLSVFTNGTIALLTAFQALDIKGEVITTPYTFVATTHSLLWNGIEPVFVDIAESSFNIDPEKIEMAITDKTSAILPVHTYGYPCDIEKISQIANKHNLKVIYDAAHTFGVKLSNQSLCTYGNLSILSFHATKVFNTFEGGAIISPDKETKQKIDFLKNFGFADETTVLAPGINGKMNELQAAFGILQLEHVSAEIDKRRKVDEVYRTQLKPIKGITSPPLPKNTIHNYSYFPILVGPNYPISRDELNDKLRSHGIYSRRYFYPLVSEFPMYKSLPSAVQSNLKNALDLSRKILCLPIYPSLDKQTIDIVVDLIAER